MSVIGSLAVNIVARTDQLQKGLKRARGDVKSFDRGIGANMATLKRWHGAIVAASGALGLGFMIRQQIREIDALGKFSDRIGIATEALSGLHHAAQLSGIQANQLNMGLQRMTRRVSEAARGTGEAKAAIAELGVNAAHLGTLTPDKQLGVLADALNRVETQSDKVRLAFKLFDSEGVAILQMTENGSAGLAAMADEAERLGKTLDRIDVKKVEELNDQWTRMTGAGEGLANKSITTFAPMVTKWLEFLESEIDHMSRGPAAIIEGLREGAKGRGGGFSIGAFQRGWEKVARPEQVGKERISAIQEALEAWQPDKSFTDRVRGLGDRIEKLTGETSKLWHEFSSFPAKFKHDELIDQLKGFGRFAMSLERTPQQRKPFHETLMEQLQGLGRFGRSLSFRPEKFTPDINAALEEGTMEAFKAQRSGKRQELERERTRLMKDEVKLSKEISKGIQTLISQGRETISNIISIPSA